MRVPSEHQEQCMLFAWAAYRPVLALLHAIPNGGKRDIRTDAMLKAEGVKPGVPDIFLPIARGPYHGMYIELKRRKGGVLSKEQEAWIRALDGRGVLVQRVPRLGGSTGRDPAISGPGGLKNNTPICRGEGGQVT